MRGPGHPSRSRRRQAPGCRAAAAATGPERASSTRARPARGRCSSGSGASNSTAAVRAAGARRRRVGGADDARARRSRPVRRARRAARRRGPAQGAAAAGHRLAPRAGRRGDRRHGSTGKTSTKDLLLALLAPHRRTVASRANFNTEIGLPLEILAAPAGHRGAGARDGDARRRARSPSWPRSPSPTSA